MPKFKVGDVVRAMPPSGDAYTYTILHVSNTDYTVTSNDDGLIWEWLIESCDVDELDIGYRAARQFDKDLNTLLEE
jgi:hypothetical protein